MQDDIKPMGSWSFNKAVSERFSDMLERSIPGYNEMREMVFELCNYYQKDNFSIVDLGASTCESIARLYNKYKNKNTFYAVDNSKDMIKQVKKEYPTLFNDINYSYLDLRYDFPEVKDSIIFLSILTLQFIPIEYRQNIIKKIYDSLNKEGIFIFVEKVLGNGCEIDNGFVNTYYRIKSKNKYSNDQIERKRLSLQGVLVPLKSLWNIDLLKTAGFNKVEIFWKKLNFEGYVAIK